MYIRTKDGGIILGARDLDLLRGLYESRVMTTAHVARIYFEGRAEMAKKRLQKLKSARLVRGRPRSTFERSCLVITSRGIGVLRPAGQLRKYERLPAAPGWKRSQVSGSTLAHELAVMDVKAAFHAAAPSAGRRVLDFATWPALNRFESGGATVKPDAFVRVEDLSSEAPGTQSRFYLELDRSTESLRVLVERAQAYRACGQASRCVAPQTWSAQRGRHEFVALFVLQSEARLQNLARALLAASPPVRSLVWLATQREVLADPFGPIWRRPRDLEQHNRPFDSSRTGAPRLRLAETSPGNIAEPAKIEVGNN